MKKKKAIPEYVLPTKFPKVEKCVLSCDPGSRNFGIACVGVSKGKAVVLANAILTNPIAHMTAEHTSEKAIFLAEIKRWLDLFKPSGIISERFQARGGKGPLVELVTSMIISMNTKYDNLPSKMITASTWKNKFHTVYNEHSLDDLYKVARVTPHQLDAILIGCYGLSYALKTDLIMTPENIIAQAEATSCVKLINRKAR